MKQENDLNNPSRRGFLTGRLRFSSSRNKSDVLQLSIELLNCSRISETDSTDTAIKYTVLNSGIERASIIVKRRRRKMTQVMKLIHLDPQEIYDGSWKEHDLDRRESYAIEVEARYKRETITREHIFSQSDAQ